MAKSVDITYFSDATATCSNCGSVYTLGMTREKIQLEICGTCHPFYTGQEIHIDTAGRIQRFNERSQKLATPTNKASKQKKVRKFRQSLVDLEEAESTQPTTAELTVEVKGLNNPELATVES